MDIVIEETYWDKFKKFYVEEINTKRLVLIVLSFVFVIKNLVYDSDIDINQNNTQYKSTKKQDEYLTKKYLQFGFGLFILFLIYIGLRYVNQKQEEEIYSKIIKEEEIEKKRKEKEENKNKKKIKGLEEKKYRKQK
jgi:hypothetical protein